MHSEKLAVELLRTILSRHDLAANTDRAVYIITGLQNSAALPVLAGKLCLERKESNSTSNFSPCMERQCLNPCLFYICRLKASVGTLGDEVHLQNIVYSPNYRYQNRRTLLI